MIPKRNAIQSDKAPAAVGSYSQAIHYADTVYISGQIPLDANGNLVEGSFEDRVHQVMNNVSEVAKAAGTDIKEAIQVSVFLTDINRFSDFDTVYRSYLAEPFPARALIEVSQLPKGVDVEVTAIIACPK